MARHDPNSYVRVSAAERAFRDEVQLLVQNSAMIRATLSERERVCGKDNCRCASGKKHKSLYIVSRQDGESRQLYVPKHLEAKARQWVKNYMFVQELLEQVSNFCWKRLEERD